jgi:hypothetical protein
LIGVGPFGMIGSYSASICLSFIDE